MNATQRQMIHACRIIALIAKHMLTVIARVHQPDMAREHAEAAWKLYEQHRPALEAAHTQDDITVPLIGARIIMLRMGLNGELDSDIEALRTEAFGAVNVANLVIRDLLAGLTDPNVSRETTEGEDTP